MEIDEANFVPMNQVVRTMRLRKGDVRAVVGWSINRRGHARFEIEQRPSGEFIRATRKVDPDKVREPRNTQPKRMPTKSTKEAYFPCSVLKERL